MSKAQLPSPRPAIGIVGTFDVANFGDLLFPEIAAFELERRLGAIDLRRYSHRPMSSSAWPFEVRPVDELIDTIDELALLIVGGGHLVRFDGSVAPGYGSVSSSVPHPAGYWLSPTLAAAAAGIPVAWNSLGASKGTPDWARPLLAGALEAVDYVSVRDPDSLEELASVAPSVAIRLVPDSAFGIRAVLETRAPSPDPRFLDLIAGRPYVIVQPSKGLGSKAAEIVEAVRAIDASEVAILELPVSPVLGDRLGSLGDLSDRAITLDAWPDPLNLAGLIAGAQAVVAHSLHLSIVALAHGVPVFRAAMPAATKYGHLAGYPGITTISDADSLASGLIEATPSTPSTQVLEQIAQLEEHWDRIAAASAALEPGARATRRRAGRRVLARLPSTLAQADAELKAAASARDALDDQHRNLAERNLATAQMLAEAARRATELAERVGELELEVARERAQGSADRQRSAGELANRRSELKAARAEVTRLKPKAASLDRLRRRRSVRVALAAGRAWHGTLRAVGAGGRTGGAATDPTPARTRISATVEEERAVGRALLGNAPGSDRVDGPRVSIVILNRDGVDHLRRLLPALERTTYRAFEVVVVDNASTDPSLAELEGAAARLPISVIRNAENRAFGEANNQAVATTSGDLLLFLNNDVEPLGPGWLGRMVDTLEESSATAVGARLVYPRRESLDTDSDRRFPDLTLQHRGIGFVSADGVPTGKNLGTGSDPAAPAATEVKETAAVTAACLLVRRDAFAAVGGFTDGYMYGTEDVDLSMKLRAAGGTIVFDGGAVLWHHEYGTQDNEGRDWKRQNRTRNRQLFVDRWGPQVFREVFRDRALGLGHWSEAPLHVAVTLTRDDPTAGWGDYYTAHELGDELAALGWTVSYAERHGDAWYALDPSVDVVISLLDAFDVRRIPRGIVTVAWVRNWTQRWADQPWFDEYDIVLASSAASRDIIAAGTSQSPSIMPLATNPQRFTPRAASDAFRSDLTFVGNSWGVRRAVQDVLPNMGSDRVIRVYGRDWDTTELAPFDQGSLAYEHLPEAYASARLVVDDTAGPTLPYGAVNARVFDALAAGALVVSDNEVGVRELFGPDFPVARDAAELEAHLAEVEADPDAAAALQARLRTEVLEHHTYAHRASEVRDHLVRWVDAERYAILVGAPAWEVAATWGDYHFARDLQRQLGRRGHPTRIHLLDEWNRAPSARADVAVHLHGLSDHRTRPSQLNLLWIISHPDRVTPQTCDRYDVVFVASDPFAAQLAGRVRTPVMPLHQATDPDRFFPDPTGPEVELLFVANTRGVRRAIVDDLTPTTHELAIYGKGWTTDLVDPIHVRGDQIPNAILHRYYSSARIVLNDHWADMRAHGFLSNRLYDALACGAFVISDDASGIADEFDGTVLTYRDREELRLLVDQYLDDPEARRRAGERGRAVVLERHTFGHRVDRIIDTVASLELSRPSGIEDWPQIDAWIDRRRRRLRSSSQPAASQDASALDGSTTELPRAASTPR